MVTNLPPLLFEQWLEVVNIIYSFQFDNADENVSWKWSNKGKFTTKSVYNHLTSGGYDRNFKHAYMEGQNPI
jgi:hypothetical protein